MYTFEKCTFIWRLWLVHLTRLDCLINKVDLLGPVLRSVGDSLTFWSWKGRGKGYSETHIIRHLRRLRSLYHCLLCLSRFPWNKRDGVWWPRKYWYRWFHCLRYLGKVSLQCSACCPASSECSSDVCENRGKDAGRCISTRRYTWMDALRSSYRLMSSIVCWGPFSFRVHPDRERTHSLNPSSCSRTLHR